MKTTSEIEDPEVRAFAQRAEDFVARFPWCAHVDRCAAAFAIAGVLGVFRVDLTPAHADADPTVWVVIGDAPSAYLVFDEGDTWQDALRGYVEEMQLWVDAVRAGGSVAELIPVNVPPAQEYADMLASRLTFIRSRLIDVDPTTLESDV
jgi:hypothetical protein